MRRVSIVLKVRVGVASTDSRICSTHRLWSVFGKSTRGKNGKARPPAHDDLVERDFTAEAPNMLWLADITKHLTDEGKVYLRMIKDVFSNRIVGYSIDSRMKSRLATTALQRHHPTWRGGWLHSAHRQRIAVSQPKFVHALSRHNMVGSMGRVRGRRQRGHGDLL
jgi:transposase InsO family protein